MHAHPEWPSAPLAVLLVLPVLLELALLFWRPATLSRLAFIPIGHRAVRLTPQAREALVARTMTTVDYRTAPVESFERGRLAEPAIVAFDGSKKLTFTPDGDIVVAPTFSLGRKHREVLRATLALEGDQVIIRAKSYPVGPLPVLVFMGLVLSSTESLAALCFLVPFLMVIALAMVWWSARANLDGIAREVSRRVARLAPARAEDTGIRIAIDHGEGDANASTENPSHLGRPTGSA